ncbi:MAG: Maf family protein [Mycobacteriaceae bacterium]
MTKVVLASASPARLAVLQAAGVDPVVLVSGVDEDALIASLGPHITPEEVTVALAAAKAQFVFDNAMIPPEITDDAVVIGCDSMLHINGELQGKPHTVEAARIRWLSMMGRSGDLLTGHAVLRLINGEIVASQTNCSSTKVFFGHLSTADLEAYLATGEPLEVAGGFTLDRLGGWFIDKIDGDPSSVIGIGLPLLRRLIENVGVSPSTLWSLKTVS